MASETEDRSQLSLLGFGASHAGRARDNNEDSFYCDPLRGVFGVIDGMGGHAAGEEAARIAREAVVATLLKSEGDVETRLRDAITEANNEIFRRAQENPEWNSMACVLTLALIEGGNVTVGHVGDTRLYRLRHGNIKRVTRDHSLVGDLEDKCILTELEAMHHPRRNEVLRDAGTQQRSPNDPNFIDIYRFNFQEDDVILLCTDGLSDMLTAKQILEIAESNKSNPQETVNELIRAANKAGGKDNVTVLSITGRSYVEVSDSDITRDFISEDNSQTRMATIYKRAADKKQPRTLFVIVSSRWGEFFGLLLASSVVVFGLILVYQAKTTNPQKTPFSQIEARLKNKELINLNKVTTTDLIPVLTAFEDNSDRKFAADKISEFVTGNKRSLDSVASLNRINIDRKEIDENTNLVVFKARLARIREEEKLNPPEKAEQPIKLLADFSQFKPLFIVRTPSEFKSEFLLWCSLAVLIFYAIHTLWRVRTFKGDGSLLPLVHLLSGLGLILMITLRDPLRDSLSFKDFTIGVIIGGAALFTASLINFQRLTSKVVWKPLLLAAGLSVLLLVFGKGPGVSDAKVNLWLFQPAEFIKIFLVFFLAGYFAENWEYLRELRQKGDGLLALLRRWKAPRLAEIAPVSIAMAASLIFFFLQRDLGPALIMGLTFVSLYAVARSRFKAALFGLVILAGGIWIGYKTATPLVVYQRIRIWLDIWDNGLRNGDQIAQAWWALSMGRYTGTGLGLGSPSLIPAGHTDLVLASVGEELGFTGVAMFLLLYALLIAMGFRIALRSQSDYGFFLALGLVFILAFEIVIITSGVLGLFPLSGVVSPFASFGKSSMIANCGIVGVLLSLSASTQSKESHAARFGFPLKIISLALSAVALLLVGKAAYVQVWQSDENAIAPVLTKQRDNQYRYVYNPRLADALKLLPQGTIYDRHGIPLATSDWSELEKHRKDYENLGINIDVACKRDDKRFYPFGLSLFHFLGDARTRENWSASNSAYLERDYAWRLRGFNDHVEKIQKTVIEIDHVTKQITPREVEVLRHDYSDVLPLLWYRNRPSQSDYQELLQRERNLRTSIDAGLQLKAGEVLRLQLSKQNLQKGAAVLIDASTGEVLAMVSFPLPMEAPKVTAAIDANDLEQSEDRRDQFLNRSLYGLYPPGSTFKIVTAIAALRKDPSLVSVRHECKTLGEGRVGNYVKGWGRPVRDAEEDHAHGTISMEEGIVHSCNAFFGQFAFYDVGSGELWRTANLFEIAVAKPNTAQTLNDSLPWSAFGQGQVLASPFQMARVAATIANGGLMPFGKWVIDDSNQRVKESEAILNRPESAIIARAMRAVVERGTAANLKSIMPPISGKTGTAEIENGAPHSWFIGFAPVGNSKRVAFAVIIENGGFGKTSAAPVAGEIVKAVKSY